MIEYLPEFKANHKTAYFAEEYERLGAELAGARESAGTDPELMAMA